MQNQRLRNLTTGRLHTEMSHIYEDIEFITGEKGIMTHHLGMATKAMKPFLKKSIGDSRFWDGEYDTAHTGETSLSPMDEDDRREFFELFAKQPNPLFG